MALQILKLAETQLIREKRKKITYVLLMNRANRIKQYLKKHKQEVFFEN
jgi:hypothetical protein